MGMSPPALPGQVSTSEFPRRNPSNRITVPSRKASAVRSIISPDSGLNQRVPSFAIGREPTIARPLTVIAAGRKLPWLDGQSKQKLRHIPGSFGSEKSIKLHDETGASSEQKATEASPQQTEVRSVLSTDPRLRAIGSTPSLRQRARTPNGRTLSLHSESRPGLKPAMSREGVPHALGIAHEPAESEAEYTSSEYSKAISTEGDEMPSGLEHKTSTTYENLVNQTPSDADVSLSPSPMPFTPQQLRHKALLRQIAVPVRRSSLVRSDSYAYADPVHLESATRAAEGKVQVSKRMPDGDGPVSPKPTLQIIPPHLLAGSDTSSLDVSPTALLPPRQVVHKATDQSLSKAVTGLEDLMNEALLVAKDAAKHDRPDEVVAILDEATTALRRASTVHGRMSQPLVVSDAELGLSSDSESASSSDASSMHSRQPSVDTAPTTLMTQSAKSSRQPVLAGPYKVGNDKRPVSHEVIIDHGFSSEDESITQTPPRLYQPRSADSIAIDWAYAGQKLIKHASFTSKGDIIHEATLAEPESMRPPAIDQVHRIHRRSMPQHGYASAGDTDDDYRQAHSLRRLEPTPTNTVPYRAPSRSRSYGRLPDGSERPRRRHKHGHSHRPHVSDVLESSYYRHPSRDRGADAKPDASRYEEPSTAAVDGGARSKRSRYSDPEPIGFIMQGASLKHPRRHHISLGEHQPFSLGRHHRRQPIAREWKTGRKRIAAAIACSNTAFVGLLIGIYAGEVPRIQYQIADMNHQVIYGNTLLYIGMALTTLLFWPLPLLHGRKPYTLLAFAVVLPLQFPQALSVASYREPTTPTYRIGLLLPRAISGLALGFANVNFLATLFDLFGVSLQSSNPHQELVVLDDVRRQGGGVGLWLGIWAWCSIGSLAVGFAIGAGIIAALDPAWGFYIVVALLALFMLINVIAPETRRAPYRRSIAQFVDDEEKIKRRVARGEVKLHISADGPKWWFEECWAGVVLMKRMLMQPGFFVLMLYLGWIYAQVVLVIILLGALLSRDYVWRPQWVGLCVLALAGGALAAVPLSKASLFSRARTNPARTDSMTFQRRVTWTSHLVRRCVFTLTLPFAGLAYTLASPGPQVSAAVPTLMAALVGFLSNLAIAECIGLIMETFDTSDLQPGVNSKHRLQSMASATRRRRTNYSSFPRVCAGVFLSQSLGFFLAAAATGVSGGITRALGAQTTTAIVAGILLVLTVLLLCVLWRWKEMQVIPNGAFGTMLGSKAWNPGEGDEYWKPVIIGHPSGKVRRLNALELGAWSRWTEIRRLNKLTKG